MRSKNTKTTLFMYLPYECSAVEEYLEEMAEKGWLLEAIKRSLFKFKKTEIKKIKYSVDVLDRVSIFDHKDSDVALEYRDYCEAAGWTYVCENAKTQIFYTQGDKKTISIHTDEEEKFKIVFKASIYIIIAQMVSIIFLIYGIYMQLTDNVEFSLASNLGIFSIVFLLSFILMNCIDIINFYVWVIKAKNKLKKNKLIPYNNYKQLKRKNILIIVYNSILLLILLVFLIYYNNGSHKLNIILALIMLMPITITIVIKKITDKKKYSKNTNIAITISSILVSSCLVSMLVLGVILDNSTKIKQGEVPSEKASLTIMDFGYKKNEDKSSYNYKNSYIEFDKSILAQRIKYSYKSVGNSLEYTIFESKYPLLIKLQENSVISRYKYINFKQEKTNLPSNIRVYIGGSLKNFYVLVSEDKVIFILKGVSDIRDDEFLNMTYKKLF